MSAEALKQYRDLLARLEDKFAEIRNRYPSQFQCRQGCHSCCKPKLTVNQLEKASLQQHILETPGLAESLAALQKENPHQGKRCNFLSAEGACAVYSARPLVCRSHGAPLQFRPLQKDKSVGSSFGEPVDSASPNENLRHRDVCPLNFTSEDISKLPPDAVLNLDTLNTLLSLLNRMAYPGSEDRIPIEVTAVLSSGA